MIKIFSIFIIIQISLHASHPVSNPLQWINKEYKKFRTYPRINMAYKHIKKGEDAEAKKLLVKALEIDPKNKKALEPLISLCLKENDKTCIRKYVDFLKHDQLAYYYFYNAEEKIAQRYHLRAKEYALKALEQDLLPHDRYYAKLIIIEANIKLKNYDEASIYIDKLYYSKSIPHYKKYQLYLVRLSIEIGRLDLAKAQVKKYLDAGNIPTDEQLLRWSKISDNLGDPKYAYYLASMLSPKPNHLQWQVDLLSKQGKYIQASKPMELLYAKVNTPKNKTKLLYLYSLTAQQTKTIKIYKDTLKKGCDEFSILFLLDTYKYNQVSKEEVLRNNYPFECVSDKKKLELKFAYIDLVKKTNFTKAKELLVRLEKRHQNNEDAYLNLSNSFFLFKECKKSIFYAQKHLDRYPENTQALKNAGYCYDTLNKKGIAAYYLSKANKLLPEDLELAKSLGIVYAEIDRPRKALRIWQTNIAETQDNTLNLSSSILLYDLKLYDKSLASLSLYESNNGNKNSDYYLIKAKLFKEKNNCEKSLQNYKLATKIDSSAYLKYEYALELDNCKKTDEAILIMKKLTHNNPKNKNYKMQLALMGESIGDYSLSIANLKSLSKQNPNDANLHISLAYNYLKNSNKKEAVYSFKKAVDILAKQEEAKLYLLKSEIKTLTKKLDVYFAQTSRLDNYNADTNISPGTIQIPGASYEGSGGLTIAYRPEFLENYLSIFAEVVYGKQNSFKDEAQASIGLKYQPFKEYSWTISIQNIFNTTNFVNKSDIFLRTSASFFDGYAYKPKFKTYYNNLYLDTGYYLKKQEVIIFGNYEFGKIYKQNRYLAYLPYLTSGASFSNTENSDKSRLDVGAGISMINWFYETKYDPYMFTTRLKIEGRIKYAGNTQDNKTFRIQFEIIY